MSANLHDRVLDKIERLSIPEPNSGCLLWIGRWDRDTYGIMSTEGRRRRAHRVAYEVLCEAIPDGLVIDHLCRTPCCINPDHLEAISQADNMRRGTLNPTGQNFRKTHCLRGHSLSGSNLYIARNGNRICRACGKARNLARNKRRRAEKETQRSAPALSLGGPSR